MTRPGRLPLLGTAVALVDLTGCAAPKYRMLYEIPPAAGAPEGVTVAIGPVVDARGIRGDIDRVLERTAVEDIATILERELLATGRVGRVVRETDGRSAAIAIDTELRDLRWETPNHETGKRTAALVGALTGGLGAAVYGMTPADVWGHSRLVVRVRNLRTGATVLDREYVSKVHRRMSKINADGPGTKADMATRAVQALMIDLRADLAPLLADDPK